MVDDKARREQNQQVSVHIPSVRGICIFLLISRTPAPMSATRSRGQDATRNATDSPQQGELLGSLPETQRNLIGRLGRLCNCARSVRRRRPVLIELPDNRWLAGEVALIIWRFLCCADFTWGV
jgi:hypothetical protein